MTALHADEVVMPAGVLHHRTNDGRALCMTPGATDGLAGDRAYCGACFLVLTSLNVVTRLPWHAGASLPVAERPSAALARLRGTPWAALWDLTKLTNADDRWWHEHD